MPSKTTAGTATAPATCAFCRGTGRDPFGIMSYLSTCCVCGGTGKVSVKKPHVGCAFCRGTGVYPHSRLTCSACGGIGVHALGEKAGVCPNCLGSAVEPTSHAGLYCMVCHGAGMVTEA